MASHAPRPAQFGPRYAAMFEAPDVARSYAGRPPYPEALFDCLFELADPACPVVLDVGGLDLLDRYEARIAIEDPFLQTADDMSFFCHGDGMFLKLDQDGRIMVSDFIREHSGIADEVAFVGRGQFFQIWEPGRLRSHAEGGRARLLGVG